MNIAPKRYAVVWSAALALAVCVSSARADGSPRPASTRSTTLRTAAADHTQHARRHRHSHHRAPRHVATVIAQTPSNVPASTPALPARNKPHRGRTHGTVPTQLTHSRAPKSHADRSLTPFDRTALLEMPERALASRTNFELESWMKALESGRGPPRGSPTRPLWKRSSQLAFNRSLHLAPNRSTLLAGSHRSMQLAVAALPAPRLSTPHSLHAPSFSHPPPLRVCTRVAADSRAARGARSSAFVFAMGLASGCPHVRRPEGATACFFMPSIGGSPCPA